MGKWERIQCSSYRKVVVTFDVHFNGRLYKDVRFALDDRTEKTTKCLMNQDFMMIEVLW